MHYRSFRSHSRRHAARIAFMPVFAFCLATLLAVPSLQGQARSGVTGTVTDSAGAAVPNAIVTITNSATGVATHTVTTSAGTYVSTALDPGRYTITVEASGFKTSVQSNVIVEIAVQATIDFALAPGVQSQQVVVTANAIELNTTAPELGTTLEPAVLNAIPIKSRATRGRSISLSSLHPEFKETPFPRTSMAEWSLRARSSSTASRCHSQKRKDTKRISTHPMSWSVNFVLSALPSQLNMGSPRALLHTI